MTLQEQAYFEMIGYELLGLSVTDLARATLLQKALNVHETVVTLTNWFTCLPAQKLYIFFLPLINIQPPKTQS